MAGESAGHEPQTQQYDSINELTIVGEFGFQRVPGPFEVVKDGTIWGIVVPEDTHQTVSTLSSQEGEAATLVADGETIGGGIVTDVVEVDDHDELHVLVDQYAMGGDDR